MLLRRVLLLAVFDLLRFAKYRHLRSKNKVWGILYQNHSRSGYKGGPENRNLSEDNCSTPCITSHNQPLNPNIGA